MSPLATAFSRGRNECKTGNNAARPGPGFSRSVLFRSRPNRSFESGVGSCHF
jgi:hypothetical protein